eukprot:scaffold4254_cov136-Skeletonema_marinoi.AAC.6
MPCLRVLQGVSCTLFPTGTQTIRNRSSNAVAEVRQHRSWKVEFTSSVVVRMGKPVRLRNELCRFRKAFPILSPELVSTAVKFITFPHSG